MSTGVKVGDYVVLEASLFVAGVFVAFMFLLSSRNLITFKRWYDFSFLYGLALLSWGLGHLFGLHSSFLLQLISMPTTFLFYLFLLFSFHAFPLSPHLYYDRWKTMLDIVIITAIFLTLTVTIWYDPTQSSRYVSLLHLQSSLFILGRAFTIYMANQNNSQRDHSNLLLIGAILFLLIESAGHHVFKHAMYGATVISFVIILLGLRRMRKLRGKVDVLDEYLYFHEKLGFQFRDEHVNRGYFFVTIIIMIVVADMPAVYLVGMLVTLLLLLIRIFATRRANQESMKEMFGLSRSLEKQFEENMWEIKQKNDHLSNLLSVKQSYEKLLMESNRQNMQQVHYENLHQLIEEIAEAWYENMIGLDYLRISLQSKEGESHYEIVRGSSHTDGKREQKPVSFCLQVDERLDTPLIPGQIVIEALTSTVFHDKFELEDSFFDLLAIHVRALIQRCLQNQQALDLRLVEQEMELASKIQFSLIPKERLILPYAEAKVVYLPVASVGGDYVDFVTVDDRYSCFLVADVSGHGLPSSLLATGLRSYFRAVLQTCTRPDQVLSRLNALMYDELSKVRSFITLFVAVYDQQDNMLRISRAGHPQPLYLSAAKQLILPCSSGVGLGLLTEPHYQMDEWPIQEEFTLVIYSDGLIDLGRKEEKLTASCWLERFQRIAYQPDRAGIDRIAAIEDEVYQLTRMRQQDDDISLLILSFHG